ncbi:hypothetical protein ABZ946_04935 [Streptomyces sp. NPDC046324]|uniref:hypothetical protein n=1 Tax=Streptomyces sp. NPDC046324 TaxID=3154915 RepID=UPI0033CEB2EB
MSDRSVDGPPPSEQTGNEISGGSHVGGNAFQARNIHFGGRSVGLTLVALALVGAVVTLVLTGTGGSGPDQLAAAPASTTAGAAPTSSPTPSTPTTAPTSTAVSPSPSSPSRTEEPAAGPSAAAPKATSTRMAPTGSTPYSGGDIYCGEWRGSGQSPNLRLRACVQVVPAESRAMFGVIVENVGKSQVTADVHVMYTAGAVGECPLGSSQDGIRIDPGGTWFSDLGRCSVPGLNRKDFQGTASAVEDPDGTVAVSLGTARHSAHPYLENGRLTCRHENRTYASCAPWAYKPE